MAAAPRHLNGPSSAPSAIAMRNFASRACRWTWRIIVSFAGARLLYTPRQFRSDCQQVSAPEEQQSPSEALR